MNESRISAAGLPEDGRRRAVIENVQPAVDGGRFPVKRALGETVVVRADVFADGSDVVACALLHRKEEAPDWQETPMRLHDQDGWEAEFTVTELGVYRYTIAAWIDGFQSWRRALARRVEPDDVAAALALGVELIEQAMAGAPADDRARLEAWAARLREEQAPDRRRTDALDAELAAVVSRCAARPSVTRYERELAVIADRPLARCGAWYEFFPRSTAGGPPRHAALRDCEQRLPYIAAMGFDVIYLPPVHPIGRVHRKGPNNTLTAGPDDPGSPWAIGSGEGGHKCVHPALGTLAEFRRFVGRARDHGLEVALDVAFQCAPDHPYAAQHPEWFRRRPDGAIQYAENPPKKYQDIYPFDFETAEWRELWAELESIFLFWIEQGVTIFRVDNPHTKPFPMWEWMLDDLRRRRPDVIFLAEAFTRPVVMHRLAKLGFNQSYNYFPWRNTKQELTEYLTELTQAPEREYFRPNLWPNTPDILTEYLQLGGRPAFIARFVLAATLGASYGIYGPAYELAENAPREPGGEEYQDSEKYQLRHWNLQASDSLSRIIAHVNRIRREHPALQHDWSLRFHAVDNDQLIAYSKTGGEPPEILLMIVNLDPHHVQSGRLEAPLEAWRLASESAYQVHDLLSGARYLWHGRSNYVQLDPAIMPAHIFQVRRRVRTERDFDYYM